MKRERTVSTTHMRCKPHSSFVFFLHSCRQHGSEFVHLIGGMDVVQHETRERTALGGSGEAEGALKKNAMHGVW